MSARLAPGAVLIVVTLLASGCSSTLPRATPTAAEPTGRMDLVLVIEDRRDGRFQRFRVDRAGTLHQGGGKAAIAGTETWSRPLKPEEIEAILSTLDEHDWWSGLPSGRAEPKLLGWRIELASGRFRRRTWGTGDDASVAALREVLAGLAAERFAPN